MASSQIEKFMKKLEKAKMANTMPKADSSSETKLPGKTIVAATSRP